MGIPQIKKVNGSKPFNKRLWQSNYGVYPERSRREHVIRNDKSLQEIREYIMNNPANWEKDEENPKNK